MHSCFDDIWSCGHRGHWNIGHAYHIFARKIIIVFNDARCYPIRNTAAPSIIGRYVKWKYRIQNHSFAYLQRFMLKTGWNFGTKIFLRKFRNFYFSDFWTYWHLLVHGATVPMFHSYAVLITTVPIVYNAILASYWHYILYWSEPRQVCPIAAGM